VLALVGDFPVPKEYIEERRRAFGLDQPIVYQALLYFKNLLMGDLGYSFVNQQSVLSLILGRALNTLILVIPALTIASLVGIMLGAAAIRKPGGRVDLTLNSAILIVDSIPTFWLGQIFIIVFAVELQLLPVQGMFSIRATNTSVMVDFIRHWILPGSVVVIFSLIAIARVARVSMIEVSRLDYIVTATAMGLSKREIFTRHILPNAIIPVLSVIGYSFGQALTSTFMTEAVFGWPGIGDLFLSSIGSRDYPVLQGIFLLTAIMVVAANLATDMLYAVMDPRVDYDR
jgi:peptide/nickel transport system permease protein